MSICFFVIIFASENNVVKECCLSQVFWQFFNKCDALKRYESMNYFVANNCSYIKCIEQYGLNANFKCNPCLVKEFSTSDFSEAKKNFVFSIIGDYCMLSKSYTFENYLKIKKISSECFGLCLDSCLEKMEVQFLLELIDVVLIKLLSLDLKRANIYFWGIFIYSKNTKLLCIMRDEYKKNNFLVRCVCESSKINMLIKQAIDKKSKNVENYSMNYAIKDFILNGILIDYGNFNISNGWISIILDKCLDKCEKEYLQFLKQKYISTIHFNKILYKIFNEQENI